MHDLGADEACDLWPSREGDGEEQRRHRGPRHRGLDAQHEHERWKGADRLDAAPYEGVRRAAEEPGRSAERATEQERCEDGSEREDEIRARSMHHAGEHVPSVAIGPERMGLLRSGRCEHRRTVRGAVRYEGGDHPVRLGLHGITAQRDELGGEQLFGSAGSGGEEGKSGGHATCISPRIRLCRHSHGYAGHRVRGITD